MPFKFEAGPTQKYSATMPGFGNIESLELREDALVINGTAHPLVEWLYPVNSKQITEPVLIFNNQLTGQDVAIPLSLMETLFGKKIPLPSGYTGPGTE